MSRRQEDMHEDDSLLPPERVVGLPPRSRRPIQQGSLMSGEEDG